MMSRIFQRKGVTGLGILGIVVMAVLAAGLATTGLVTDSSSPTIINASLYPEKVKDGEVLLIRAEVENAQEVTANIEHEKGFDVEELTLKEENIYEGSWVAHDLKNQAWYNVTINASNDHGSSTQTLSFQDPTVWHPASQVTAGTFDSGDYTFPNNLEVQNNLSVSNDALFVDNSTGKVGIGTTSPGAKLDVAGKIKSQNAIAQAQLTEVVTTTSTSYVDVTGASVTITTEDNPILIIWSPTAMQGLGTTCRVHFRVLLDGTPVAGSTDEFHNSGWELRGPNIAYLATSPGAGSHTIKVQWRIDTGTEARLNWHEPDPGYYQTSQLIAIEL